MQVDKPDDDSGKIKIARLAPGLCFEDDEGTVFLRLDTVKIQREASAAAHDGCVYAAVLRSGQVCGYHPDYIVRPVNYKAVPVV